MCHVIKAYEGYRLKNGNRYLNINSEVFCIIAFFSTSLDTKNIMQAYDGLWKSKKKTLKERVKEVEQHYKVKIKIEKLGDDVLDKTKKICITIS